jgi:hypothetical protein
MCLDDILKMHDCVGTGVYLLMGNINLPPVIVQPMLGLAKAVVRDL